MTANSLSITTGPRDKPTEATLTPEDIIATANNLRWQIGDDFHEQVMTALYADATEIAARAVTWPGEKPRFDLDHTIDGLVTSRRWGFPIMILLFTVVIWITIVGANYPSQMLSALLLDTIYPWLKEIFAAIGIPWWLDGLVLDGMYLTTAWVIAVMLPPMAIFFPLFTLLEDFGYLPRVAFNLDNLFRKSGAHGKQSLSMMMGYGCNAAGVIATRIIDSPRERMIAIVTNNFALCNGRWPTIILISVIFIGALAPPLVGGLRVGVDGRRRGHAGRLPDLSRFLGAFAHLAAWRGVDLQPGTAALPTASCLADHLHVAHRSYSVRAVAGHRLCLAGGRRHLADLPTSRSTARRLPSI